METELTSVVFLRPLWLWALVPIVAGWLSWWFADRRHSSGWEAVVDPALRPYVIEDGGAGRRRSAAPVALLTGWCVTILILAGPVFERQRVPSFEARASEVVLFDLSRSMLADDLQPDRSSRARFKFADLLDRAGDRNVALIGFAERPYVISPLTDDVETLRAFLPSLTPDIVPVQGSRLDLAIDQGVELLQNSRVVAGSLLAITDAVPDAATIASARDAARRGHRLLVLAVGTTAGTPLRGADGQFVKDENGAIVVPRLDLTALAQLAAAGDGIAVALSSDASDLERLDAVGSSPVSSSPPGEDARFWWVERGPWLMWPLALAALAWFRRGSTA